MKIVVLNGSPKGANSVTLRYVHYIQKEFPQHEMEIFNVSPKIKQMEKGAQGFQQILESVRVADAVLWVSPVYYMLVPSNYKRFIELIHANGAQDAFKNKHCAFLTTSIHFFDHTAINYIHAISDDLEMRYIGEFTADMQDLLKEEERTRLRLFAMNFFHEIEADSAPAKSYTPLLWREFDYLPANAAQKKTDVGDQKLLILSDAQAQQTNLIRMVEQFKDSFNGPVELVNLRDLDIKGSCTGCLQCAYDNQCMYAGKDDYVDFYNSQVKPADILVWAGTIQDRYLSSRWKMYLDRSFFNGHVPSLTGKQIGFIISGPLSQARNLRQILESYVEIQNANLGGFVSDEHGDAAQIDRQLHELGQRLVRFADSRYVSPATFLGVGGGKIFRDAIWGRMRFPFRADHVAYKKLRVYDFPQKAYASRIRNAILLFLSRFPKFRNEVNKRMMMEMINPFKKVLEK